MPFRYPWVLSCALGCLVVACGSNADGGADGNDGAQTDGSPDQVGSVCEVPADCYPEVDPEGLAGEVLCLDRVRAGYCTHECSDDAECCAVEGECLTDLPQVCSPFESAGAKMCFLSCESEDVEAAGAADDQSFCQHEASPDFICRSSGGGSENRKVCVPGDCGVGAACAGNEDCDPDLECIGDFDGGYCGARDCSANTDCPQDSRCITIDDANYCVRTCVNDGDCGFCRGEDVAAACTDEVEFVEAGTVGTVCLPPPA